MRLTILVYVPLNYFKKIDKTHRVVHFSKVSNNSSSYTLFKNRVRPLSLILAMIEMLDGIPRDAVT